MEFFIKVMFVLYVLNAFLYVARLLGTYPRVKKYSQDEDIGNFILGLVFLIWTARLIWWP